MAQISTSFTFHAPSQKLLRKQGVGARSVAVQNKFVKKVTLWIMIATALALFYIWIRVQVLHEGYELDVIRRESAELSKMAASLEVDIAKLKSPERLEDIAKNSLHMAAPTAEQIVFVKEADVNK